MKRSAAVVCLLVLLSGCGGGSKKAKGDDMKPVPKAEQKASATSSTTVRAPNSGGSATGPTQGAGPSDPSGSGTAGAQPDGSAQAPPTTSKPVKAQMSLSRSCVHLGSDELQELTVKTNPRDAVAYASEYSDGSTSLTKRYATGDGSGSADDTGTYKATWRVPENAPTGRTKVNVAAQGEFQPPLEFMIVPKNGSCP